MGDNAQAVAKAFHHTMSEISALLGDPNPENWTRDGVINRLQEIMNENARNQRIVADHRKKSFQVKRLTRKLKAKTRNTIPMGEMLNVLQDRLTELRGGGLGLIDASHLEEEKEMSRQNGKMEEVENMIGEIEWKRRKRI